MDNWIWGLKNDTNGEHLYMFEDLTRGRKPSEPDIPDVSSAPRCARTANFACKNAAEAKSENRLKICQPQHQNHSIPLEIHHPQIPQIQPKSTENLGRNSHDLHMAMDQYL
jgi:hypothetical protein